ncbi:MAG TPA: IS110 family transposase [Terriglobales bacterium]|nr:IS110 family transposase [Terriglobales bacterium]
MESIVCERIAGIDVHKKMLAVVVADAANPEAVLSARAWGTCRAELEALGDWLTEQSVKQVVMESTAQYWRPVWMALEGRYQLHLAQAQSNRGPRGRKSDFADAARLVRRLVAGELILSFVPDAEQRQWRMITRMMLQIRQQIVRLRNQMEGLLEQGQIKLSGVVSDLLGVSARQMLAALADGEADPARLAAFGTGKLRASQADLEAALAGRLTPVQQRMLRMQLDEVALLEKHLRQLEGELRQLLQPYQEVIERLSEVPGFQAKAAQEIITIVGPEATTFTSGPQLVSWAGACPGREESAGISKSSHCPKGNRSIRRLINQCAWAAVRTKGSSFQALFRRLVPRLGQAKAIWAVARHLLLVIWKVLHQKVRYLERGPRALNSQALRRRKQFLVGQLKALGFQVTLNDQPKEAR